MYEIDLFWNFFELELLFNKCAKYLYNLKCNIWRYNRLQGIIIISYLKLYNPFKIIDARNTLNHMTVWKQMIIIWLE